VETVVVPCSGTGRDDPRADGVLGGPPQGRTGLLRRHRPVGEATGSAAARLRPPQAKTRSGRGECAARVGEGGGHGGRGEGEVDEAEGFHRQPQGLHHANTGTGRRARE
ncbi:unnamed protein product, partial [Ectocarpus fasciculatus]